MNGRTGATENIRARHYNMPSDMTYGITPRGFAALAALVFFNAALLLHNTIVDPDGWTGVCVVVWHGLFAWQVVILVAHYAS